MSRLKREQRVELRRADEIVLRYPVHSVRPVVDAALAVSDNALRMVVLTMRYPCDRIHERHRPPIIGKVEGLGDVTVTILPPRKLGQHVRDFALRKRWNIAGARLASSLCQLLAIVRHDSASKGSS